ncbi:hypothetical protein TNIN_17151 [Trichonephila inaurata madagascariensis]|uniref:Uncharacterized protein n=1 Tax=Trichonephila inaurata madagascariensis TaxID=2747483 RepID=A0A8X6XJE5_9ARAC|nr:hypothetical protein TNIN_17151 [Trichonephila inaurata madagascariensis]
MFKNYHKEDLRIVAFELGETVAENVTTVELTEIVKENKCFREDAEFVKELILSTIEDRKKAEEERTTTGRDIKDAVINCPQSRQIGFKNPVGVATDGAPSIIGKSAAWLH